MHLYQISLEYRRLFDEMSNVDEWPADLLATIEKVDSDFTDKAINVALFIKELNSQAEAIKQARAEMATRQVKLENRAENLTEYLKFHMERNEKVHIADAQVELKLKRNPFSVTVDNEAEIPRDYFRRKEVLAIDKALIRQDIDKGIEVPGARLTSKIRLEIK